MAERRRGGLARLPDFGTSAEDRLLGNPAADEPPPTRRRPLKVDESLADQVRDAVLFMRGRGRPELTQNELLDELLGTRPTRGRGSRPRNVDATAPDDADGTSHTIAIRFENKPDHGNGDHCGWCGWVGFRRLVL